MIMDSEATVEATTVRATRPTPADTAFGDGIVVTDVEGSSLPTIPS
jgi:hypothetical protein